MATSSQTEELPITLRLTSQAKQRLAERAGASGTDLAGDVSFIVEQASQAPLSLAEISGPIYQRFLESGMTDEELGDLLWILAKLAWQDGIDPEEALRAANRKFMTHFAVMEQIAAERNWESFKGRALPELQSAWAEAKRRTGHQ